MNIKKIQNFKLRVQDFKYILKVLTNVNKGIGKAIKVMDLIEEDSFPLQVSVPMFVSITGKL